MPTTTMTLHASHTGPCTALGLLLMLGLLSLSQAQSLADKRLAITKGQAPGKVLIDKLSVAEAPPSPAASAASSAATSAAPAAAPPAAGKPSLFSRLPPPSGRPLNEARRLAAPDQGIVIKPAAPAASAPTPR
jgi:predicted lipid-binding transport protein (Tim44 family)